MTARKWVLLIVAVLILAGGIFVYKHDVAGRSQTQTPAITCAADQYACPCATGSYCLKRGAMCLTPTSACPPAAQ